MKLILVSIIVDERRYSAFIKTLGNKIALSELSEAFPILKTLPVGKTWSHG